MNDIFTSTPFLSGLAFIFALILFNVVASRKRNKLIISTNSMVPIGMITGIVVVATYHGLL